MGGDSFNILADFLFLRLNLKAEKPSVSSCKERDHYYKCKSVYTIYIHMYM